MGPKILSLDPGLLPYGSHITQRMDAYQTRLRHLLPKGGCLSDFANGHHYFGFHKTDAGWYYREWAPGAEALYLTGDFCNWEPEKHRLMPLNNGIFELFLPGADALQDGQRVQTVVHSQGRRLRRIPLYATLVCQEPDGAWNGVIYDPSRDFPWSDGNFRPQKPLFIYECHIGMAQEAGWVGTYREFTENILPRVKKLGYNTIQLMAIAEHPYYASFGYQVTNFFAPSSRYGHPEDLKHLINTAHEMGIGVLLDIVHSHACPNTREGICQFDGTDYQFFHEGARGDHPAWGTKCFDYGKNEVVHFLLSNLKYWLETYHFDGFRFDGITSMLYKDHGLGTAFTHYDQYFSPNTDPDAVAYLQLATTLCRQVKKNVILIAEDMSALPGLCLPVKDGGLGFDYRLAMGEPDFWIRLLDRPDESWDLGEIFWELTRRRPKEKIIGYCESHDQALVGDKTLMFRLCDAKMYTQMEKNADDQVIHRGMALHKLLRLLTATLGGEGYLTFMGNEFGHPEWIDFPRAGNGWSYHYCRRQWSLADNPDLKYQFLQAFEKGIVKLCKQNRLFTGQARQLWLDNADKVLIYEKNSLVFAVNLHPETSFEGYFMRVPEPGTYRVIMSTDDFQYGGLGRIHHRAYQTIDRGGHPGIQIYLPARTAVALQRIEN